jgi:hypothetical protein
MRRKKSAQPLVSAVDGGEWPTSGTDGPRPDAKPLSALITFSLRGLELPASSRLASVLDTMLVNGGVCWGHFAIGSSDSGIG